VIALLNLPNWWLSGCAVRNTVWRSLFGNDCQLVINDFDIAFFDALGDSEALLQAADRSQELTPKATLTAQFPDYKFDQRICTTRMLILKWLRFYKNALVCVCLKIRIG